MISRKDKIFITTSIALSVIMNYIMSKNMPSLADRNFKSYMLIWSGVILVGSILQWYIGFKIGMNEFNKKRSN